MKTDHPTYTQEQISAWLRGLMSVALADNDYSDQERTLFDQISHSDEWGEEIPISSFEPISTQELADALGSDRKVGQNFLRMAVMMALADGKYTDTEDRVIQEFCTALDQEITPINELRIKLETASHHEEHHPDLLEPVKEWLDHMDIHDSRLANLICKVIPAQCPFERDVVLFGRKIMHIPAMCEINPLYDQLVGLRFRSLSYLAEKGEDVSKYC
ncbi:MAG: Mo-dependent nitrogenase C-terminal domain-containing protein [Pseudanabaena sp.]|jgi:tellurite resistance protein|nr:TerB family tellurite resistance protein [Pseudanabaena sp. M109S1SP2A07QC]MCA6572339.1 TerB family tellurite resistance protein [Pseudanabaena sp. M53BS1SP1A06MG]MCA6581831.1 TerB family tellurite resistance protein [Pseudanabaena sp. M34BS1SP1A06MG]MCA6585933.1 TerB family tellurite resistance protein [Pseudanabaena sp. M051S1SP1A06QC]MCA6591795.1 TerB family tellurite resistance protein [Pseudanabaena sp. M38BS1SP1A06MG]MCA6598175.1 TerB family tellurite resistance protein [Pseudanabaena